MQNIYYLCDPACPIKDNLLDGTILAHYNCPHLKLKYLYNNSQNFLNVKSFESKDFKLRVLQCGREMPSTPPTPTLYYFRISTLKSNLV